MGDTAEFWLGKLKRYQNQLQMVTDPEIRAVCESEITTIRQVLQNLLSDQDLENYLADQTKQEGQEFLQSGIVTENWQKNKLYQDLLRVFNVN